MMRRYAPYWSRFSQPDPYDGSYNLTDPQSFNRYAYVQNDPVNFVDPSGLDPGDFTCQVGEPCDVGSVTINISGSGSGTFSSGGSVLGGDDYFRLVDPPTDAPTGGGEVGGLPQDPQGEFPCPPTGIGLTNNSVVIEAVNDAWLDSGVNSQDEHEEGGWIYMDRSGALSTVRAPRGNERSIDLNNPPVVAGTILVGDFHTHAGRSGGPVPGKPGYTYGNQNIPSTPDTLRAYQNGVPGVIRSRSGIRAWPYAERFGSE